MARPMYECPPGWERASLAPDRASQVIVKCDSGGTPSTRVDEYWDGGIPWLTPKEITRNEETLFVSHTERTITQTGVDNSAAKLLPPGTVMLTKRAPVGAVAINAVPMATNQGFLNFTCGKRLRPAFLALWLKINGPYLQQVANGSTYLELYKSDLFEFELALPPLDLQDAITRGINDIQFLALLGPALEQSSGSAEVMLSIQRQSRRLLEIRDQLALEFVAGRLSPMRIPSYA